MEYLESRRVLAEVLRVSSASVFAMGYGESMGDDASQERHQVSLRPLRWLSRKITLVAPAMEAVATAHATAELRASVRHDD